MFVDTIIIIFCDGCCLISFFFFTPDLMESSNTAQSMPPSVNHVLNHLICPRLHLLQKFLINVTAEHYYSAHYILFPSSTSCLDSSEVCYPYSLDKSC